MCENRVKCMKIAWNVWKSVWNVWKTCEMCEKRVKIVWNVWKLCEMCENRVMDEMWQGTKCANMLVDGENFIIANFSATNCHCIYVTSNSLLLSLSPAHWTDAPHSSREKGIAIIMAFWFAFSFLQNTTKQLNCFGREKSCWSVAFGQVPLNYKTIDAKRKQSYITLKESRRNLYVKIGRFQHHQQNLKKIL